MTNGQITNTLISQSTTGSEIVATLYGNNTYQLVTNYVDVNGVNGTITSNPINTSILVDNQFDVTGQILLGSLLSSSAASLDYNVTEVTGTASNVQVIISDFTTGQEIETINNGNNLVGSVESRLLAPYTLYYVELVATVDSNVILLDTTTFMTLPLNQDVQTVFANINVVNVTANTVTYNLRLTGTDAALNTVDNAYFETTTGQIINLSAANYVDIKAGNNTTVTMPGLLANTDYTSYFFVTDGQLDNNSNVRSDFRTSGTNDTANTPIFTGSFNHQTTAGVAEVTSN